MTSTPAPKVDARWNARIARARELPASYPAAAPVLRFYASVLEFQQKIARSCSAPARPAISLGGQIDINAAAAQLPELLQLTASCGPELLAAKARALQQASAAQWHDMFREALRVPPSWADDLSAFFLRACLQPPAENLQLQIPPEPSSSSHCPVCGGDPQAAVLRPEGDGAQRWLLCSFCLREWLFRRLVCPGCGEEEKDKLPYYSDGSGPARVEACDTCHRYLKAVDLGVDGHAVPLVDEVALAVLDVWAGQHGYTKIVPNLMGL